MTISKSISIKYYSKLNAVLMNLQPQLPFCLEVLMPTTTATAVAVVGAVVQVWVLLLQPATTTQQVIWWCLGLQQQVWWCLAPLVPS